MKACVIDHAFGLEHVAVVDRPEPAVGPGQVLVRVRAASLNYRDLLIAGGHYNPKLPFPRILGSDAAGEVIQTGSNATRWKKGDRVAGCFMQHWADGPITDSAAKSTLGSDRDGVFAEYAVFEENGLVGFPPHLTFEEAATLPCAALTAWNALTAAGTGLNSTVLLQGTGGVSIFALQFAHALGAKTFITSSSDDKLSRAAALGADAGTNYKTNPDWEKWARQQSGGSGVDMIVEVGGAGTLERSLRAVKIGGHIALIGVLAGGTGFNPLMVLMKAVRLQGVFVGSRAMFESMNQFISSTQLRPVIDRSFPLADTPAALQYLQSGSHFGKVVLNC